MATTRRHTHSHSLDCLTVVHGRSYYKCTGRPVVGEIKSKYQIDHEAQSKAVVSAIERSGADPLLIVAPRGSGAVMGVRAYVKKHIPPRSSLAATSLASELGLPPSYESILQNAFRAPHHTVSQAGLLGSSRYRAGELQLASRGGLLLLDDIAEWMPTTIRALGAQRSSVVGTKIVAVAYRYPADYKPLYGTKLPRPWQETPGGRAFEQYLNPIVREI